jgi:hypothetical protein
MRHQQWKWTRFLLVIFAGALLGYAYYTFYGCRQACPLSSSPYVTTGLGILLAGLLGYDFLLKKNGKQEK